MDCLDAHLTKGFGIEEKMPELTIVKYDKCSRSVHKAFFSFWLQLLRTVRRDSLHDGRMREDPVAPIKEAGGPQIFFVPQRKARANTGFEI